MFLNDHIQMDVAAHSERVSETREEVLEESQAEEFAAHMEKIAFLVDFEEVVQQEQLDSLEEGMGRRKGMRMLPSVTTAVGVVEGIRGGPQVYLAEGYEVKVRARSLHDCIGSKERSVQVVAGQGHRESQGKDTLEDRHSDLVVALNDVDMVTALGGDWTEEVSVDRVCIKEAVAPASLLQNPGEEEEIGRLEEVLNAMCTVELLARLVKVVATECEMLFAGCRFRDSKGSLDPYWRGTRLAKGTQKKAIMPASIFFHVSIAFIACVKDGSF